MRAIVREEWELMTSTIERQGRAFDVVVNGSLFETVRAAKFMAFTLGIPEPPAATTLQGKVVRTGATTSGEDAGDGFYLAEIAEVGANGRPNRLRYVTGAGNPPEGGKVVTAIGNVGPLIVNGLPYGTGNICRPPTYCPPEGPLNKDQTAALLQRNSQMFNSVDSPEKATTGKTIIAYHHREQALLVGVQENALSPGATHSSIRDALIVAGFSDAVFMDGSDSSLLYYNGDFKVKPSRYKDSIMNLSLGFRKKHTRGH